MLGKSWAIILLAFLLIIWGAAILLDLSFRGIGIVEGVLAILSGIFFLIGK